MDSDYLRHIAESSILSITFSSKQYLQQICVSMFNGEHSVQNFAGTPSES